MSQKCLNTVKGSEEVREKGEEERYILSIPSRSTTMLHGSSQGLITNTRA